MQTPYDSALRVQRRAMDAIRLSLLTELSREHAIDASCAALDIQMKHELTVAASDWQTTAYPYVAHQRTERRKLEHDRLGIEANLGHLRGAAMEACGLMQAIAGAAAGYSYGRIRDETAAEQVRADDFAGTRIAAFRPQLAFTGR